LTVLTSRYEVEESSTTAPRLAGGQGIDYGFIERPPRRSSATARAAATAARADTAAARADATAAVAAPMIAAAVEQLIEARVFAALANHETLQNNTNGHGDGSHNSGIGNRGTTRTPHGISVPHKQLVIHKDSQANKKDPEVGED
ncbi:hypothetical protein Tco_0221003, partial [Tanacetum coccineum]